MDTPRTKHDLRCFCRSRPLLAVYGVLSNGDLFVHVRVFKQREIFGELYIQRIGIVKIRCRSCYRWHRITIRQPGEAVLEESTKPAVIETG